MRVCQHQASSVLLKPKHNREAFANLDMLEGEEGVGGRQAVRALLLCRAQAGQEAVHEEQALARMALRMLRVQPHGVQRYCHPPVRIWPALQQRQGLYF